MKRLQSYYLALSAGIAAILVTPGNVIGLPIGIWALVVLSQREVRAAFAANRGGNGTAGGSPARAASFAAAARLEAAAPGSTDLASTGGAGGTPASSSAAKVSLCYLSTPEHLRTFRGRFLFIYKGRGELRLDHEALSFRSDWPAVRIPLSSIRKIARGDYPYSAKPVPIHFIEVTFAEQSVERTLLFTPVLREVMYPQEANRLVGEWLSAMQEAVRAGTGRTLPLERSRVAQDKFWVAKTVLLTAVVLTIAFSIIPLLVDQRLPNRLSEWLPGPITAIVTMALLLAVRWWRRRSAVASGNLDALMPKQVEIDLRRDAGTPATGATADKPAWQPPNSGWGWLIGKIFGMSFTSRLAYRCANLSALGFLGFLGFMPLPGWHGCFGFFGLFGLIGVAHMVEAFARPGLTVGRMVCAAHGHGVRRRDVGGVVARLLERRTAAASTSRSVTSQQHPPHLAEGSEHVCETC